MGIPFIIQQKKSNFEFLQKNNVAKAIKNFFKN